MAIQLTRPAVDRFDPDRAIQMKLKGSKRQRRPGFMDSYGEIMKYIVRVQRSR